MSDVYVYDRSLKPIASGAIQFIETDARGVRLDLQTNRPRGTLYGATMKLPAPAVPVGIWVDDPTMVFAPTGLEFLNPSPSLRLDVTLFPLPSAVASGGGSGGGGGGGGRTGPPDPLGGSRPADEPDEEEGQQIAARATPSSNTLDALAKASGWTEEQRHAVRILTATIASARMLAEPSAELEEWLHRWESQLDRLGVRTDERQDDVGGGGAAGPGAGGLGSSPITHRQPARDEVRLRLPDLEMGD